MYCWSDRHKRRQSWCQTKDATFVGNKKPVSTSRTFQLYKQWKQSCVSQYVIFIQFVAGLRVRTTMVLRSILCVLKRVNCLYKTFFFVFGKIQREFYYLKSFYIYYIFILIKTSSNVIHNEQHFLDPRLDTSFRIL